MAAIDIDVCNLALGEVRAPFIVSADDDTPEARACSRFYPMCLQSLLEAHDWAFTSSIATLALLANNNRGDQWAYAYQLPADFGSARRLILPTTLVSGYYYPWPYTWPRPLGFQADFAVEGTTLYTSLQSAALEYNSNDLTNTAMPAMFKKALSLDLASYLAAQLRDDSKIKGELIQQAEVAKSRAMADDINRQPNRQDAGFNEVAWARA